MWNRLTLRTRITLLVMIALSLVTVSITILSIYNARRHFVVSGEQIGFDMGFEFIEVEVAFSYFGLETSAFGDVLYFNPTAFNPDNVTAIVRTSQESFQTYSIVVAYIFVLIGTVLAYIISGQALRPVKTLARKIEDIDANNLSVKIEPPVSEDEIASLTHSFNSMLGKLNRSFDVQKLFAQNAAHELKTPLSAIMATIEVLQMDDEPSACEYREVVDTVKVSTEQLISLVEGLLSINTIIDEEQWQLFDGKEVFSKIVDDLEAEIERKELEVYVMGDCRMKGDKVLLERAFSNLIQNAIRYNVEKGSIAVTLDEEYITIKDSGIGIPCESIERIFVPFYCVDKSRSKKLGGHGLGMAIAKNVFDKHGMEVKVSSKVGVGTKITLSYPEAG